MRKMQLAQTVLQKSNVLALISLTYVISWLITAAALNVYVIYPSKFMIWEGGIYLGALTPLQGTAIILFATAGGLATMGAAFFVIVKTGDKISAYWKKQEIPIENVLTYNPAPYPEQEMRPLELGESISAITNTLKNHPYKTGIPLILLGPVMWEGFNIYAQIQASIIIQFPMFQILTIAIPILSTLSIVTGAVIIANHIYKKIKKRLDNHER